LLALELGILAVSRLDLIDDLGGGGDAEVGSIEGFLELIE